MAIDLKQLSEKVQRAIAAGHAAAASQKTDGGSANLDHVVLTDLKGVREASLKKVGIYGSRYRAGGGIHLSAPFAGQGDKRYAAVQAMAKSLQDDGVDCYIHYQMD